MRNDLKAKQRQFVFDPLLNRYSTVSVGVRQHFNNNIFSENMWRNAYVFSASVKGEQTEKPPRAL